MTRDQAIRHLMDALAFRVDAFLAEARPDSDNQANAARFYNAHFGADAAAKIARFLRRAAGRYKIPSKMMIRIKRNPPALQDVRKSQTPADLLRLQQERDEE